MRPAFARYLVGDARTVVSGMAEGSVDLVLCSPPFLALRSYLPADDADKAGEIGCEDSPGAYLDALLDVIEECRRVLAPHGSLAIELGDTYAGSGGAGGDYSTGGRRHGQQRFHGSAAAHRGPRSGPPHEQERRGAEADRQGESRPSPWPADKSLCLVPELLRVALAYGRNPLTARPTPTWRVRNVVRWCRPNPSVGALADKFRPATSELVIACSAPDRFFDLDAVRRASPSAIPEPGTQIPWEADESERAGEDPPGAVSPGRGAPPLDWWEVPTQPYPGSHHATWPPALLVTPIQAMCPRRVCTSCGAPSRRLAVTLNNTPEAERHGRVRSHTARRTPGWSDCGCPGGEERWRPGVVLDPFAGSGTTLAVALGHGRSSIGIDLDARNVALARDRVGMWLETCPDPGPS